MFRNKPLLLCFLLPPLLCGASEPPASEGSRNDCRDPASWARYEGLLRQVPEDPLVIRSYALRIGLCRLIEEGKISLEQGVEVFDVEKLRVIIERAQERAERERPKPVENLEPGANAPSTNVP